MNNSKLFNRGFLSLLVAQFFGAMNDNVLKMVLTFMVVDGAWAGVLGGGGQGLVGVCFTLPFLFLSGYGGQIADHFAKSTVTWWVKLAEVPIVAMAGIGFWTGNLWLTLLSLVALTCQSSFFGPAKYGMIPELVSSSDLSRANGLINMTTNISVIMGTVLGGWVADRYSPKPPSEATEVVQQPWLWLPAACMVAIALLGLIAAATMTRLSPGDRNSKFDWNPLTTYIVTVREMIGSPILMVMLAWGYFYMLAGLALVILPEYSTVLNVDRAEAAVLLAVMGVAIGAGCIAAGWISGDRINVRLVPLGAAGLIVFFTLLAFVPPELPNMKPMLRVACSNTSWFVFGAGFFAGFYIVPLQALLQKLSPDDERGRFLGTANAFSFGFMTVSSLVFWGIRGLFDEDNPQRMFAICAVLMAIGAAFFLWRMRGTGILVGSPPPSDEQPS